MTIMVAGGLTFAVPGVMPEAMAANANLFVSAENSQFNNRMSGPQVVEVVIVDTDINDTGDSLGEPDVTINGKKLRMVQASDGNWYGFFAEVEQAQLADYTNTAQDGFTNTVGQGLDFGTFCSPASGTGYFGFSTSETKGIAVNSNQGINGTATVVNPVTEHCGADLDGVTNNTINVVREEKTLNTAAGVTK
jgi:hypothetical protein